MSSRYCKGVSLAPSLYLETELVGSCLLFVRASLGLSYLEL